MIISALDRKLLRDLWQIRGQALAICLVMAAGIATFVMSLTTLQSLKGTRDAYYDESRFADIFVHLKRAPLTLADRMGQIPGVRHVAPRIATEVSLDVPDLNEPAVGRLVSIPENADAALNEVYLRRGRPLDPARDNEVIATEAFALAHGFHPGDHIRAIINGRRRDLEIVGIGLSPEYLIQIRAGSLLPDERRYGVFWMSYRHLAAALNMESAFNDASLSLMRGASEPEVLRRVDALAKPYGGIGAYGRDDQISHHYISQEIQQLSTMGLMAPSIFLSVAAFLLNVVLSRLISTQREQIAAIKAFGYGRREVGWHYFKMVLVLVVIGVAAGTAVGAYLGKGLTGLYCRFYKFPNFEYTCDPAIVALALLILGGASLLGTATAVWRAMRLPPAEAMRPEAPAQYQPTLLERLGLGHLVSLPARMILRQLERTPVKSALSCLGISLAVSVLVLGSYTADALQFMIDYQFQWTQRQDVTVSYFEPLSQAADLDACHLPGVLRSESFRMVPCRIRRQHRSRRVVILGLPQPCDLYRLRDTRGRTLQLPEEGLLISDKLAELLQVGVGHRVRIEAMEGARPQWSAPVSAIVREYGGLNAYMHRDALQRMMHEQGSVSGAYLQMDSRQFDDLYAQLKKTPTVASVTIKKAAIENFEKTVGENLMRIRFYNILFASIIAFGVVYNGARVSLAERSREFATLRVLGLTRREVSLLLLGELAVLTLVAIPLGLCLGYGFAAWSTLGMDTELFRIPLVVNRSTFGMAAVVTLVATLVSGLAVRQRIDQLDLIRVLKTRE